MSLARPPDDGESSALPTPSEPAPISVRALWLSLAAFVAFTSALATRHEMWRDEVRAFSVAIRAGSWAELFSMTHQEAHPILWYAILRMGYSATHSPLVLPVASIAIAAGAAYLILRFAPFPVWLRLLTVFGAFLGYELSVMCRNYGIGVLLMMAACVVFPTRRERPVRVGLTLALLANTSVPAALAALVLGFVWVIDIFAPHTRPTLLRPASMTALAIAVFGVAFALWSAHPPPGMLYTFSFSQLRLSEVLRVILADPGSSLSGLRLANVAAAGEIPWHRLGLGDALVARVITNVAIVSIAWSLRRTRACLAGMVLAVLGFEVFFQLVYSAALRQEGILAFLLISLCWIASSDPGSRAAPAHRWSIALGLVPLVAVQAAALPMMALREVTLPTSSSKGFAKLIDATPRYRDAILAGEPDFMMESMPYYVGNRVFMPRQGAFDYRVQFDRGLRRKLDFRLGELVDAADSLACSSGQPVLIALRRPNQLSDSAGEAPSGYSPARFLWNSSERSRLLQRGKLVFSAFNSTSGENYNVFEIGPRTDAGCRSADAANPPPGKR